MGDAENRLSMTTHRPTVRGGDQRMGRGFLQVVLVWEMQQLVGAAPCKAEKVCCWELGCISV